jgi:protein LSM14
MAMNEKFKKDEVWGYLGKTKDKTEGMQDYATGQSLGNREGHGLIPNPKVRLAMFP